MKRPKNNTQILKQLITEVSGLDQVILIEMISTMAKNRIIDIQKNPESYHCLFHPSDWMRVTKKVQQIIDNNVEYNKQRQ